MSDKFSAFGFGHYFGLTIRRRDMIQCEMQPNFLSQGTLFLGLPHSIVSKEGGEPFNGLFYPQIWPPTSESLGFSHYVFSPYPQPAIHFVFLIALCVRLSDLIIITKWKGKLVSLAGLPQSECVPDQNTACACVNYKFKEKRKVLPSSSSPACRRVSPRRAAGIC